MTSNFRMKWVFMLLITTLAFLHLNCSKKNAFAKNAENSNSSANGVGNLIISPTPATYTDQIKIAGTSKKIKFDKNNLEVFFTSTTNGIRYDIENTSMTILTGSPDTLKFPLPPNIPMDGYLVNVVYNNTNDTLVYRGYAILDAELIKNSVVVNGISPNEIDIHSNAKVTISGNNFSSDATFDTIILLKNGIEIYRWNGATIAPASSTAVSFVLPNNNIGLIRDIKTGGDYQVKINVKGKNSEQTPPQLLKITNSQYPTIISSIPKNDASGTGTFVTLGGSGMTTNNISYQEKTAGALMPITTANANSFFMPATINAGDYYIKIKQVDNSYLTAVDAITKDSIVKVLPYVTEITFKQNTSTTPITDIPVDYPADFNHTDSVFDITIIGANLTKNATTVAFDISANPILSGTPANATIIDATTINYLKFSQSVQSGNIDITLTNGAGLMHKTFSFYKPVITSISNTSVGEGTPIPIVITGRGFTNNMQIGFIHSTNAPVLLDASSADGTNISLDVSSLTAGSYDKLVATTNGISSGDFAINFSVTTGIPIVNEIRTLEIFPNNAVKLSIRGSNFSNDTKIVFFRADKTSYDEYNNTVVEQEVIPPTEIQITLKASPPFPLASSSKPFFNLTNDNGTSYVYDKNQLFVCVKNAVMGWTGLLGAQTSNFSTKYFADQGKYPGLYVEFLGDNLHSLSIPMDNYSITGNSTITFTRLQRFTLSGGSNFSSNSYVILNVDYIPPTPGPAEFKYVPSTGGSPAEAVNYVVTMPFYITP